MVNALSTPSTWTRQDVLALLQLLTMVLVSTIGALWHVLTRQHHSKFISLVSTYLNSFEHLLTSA
jgi:hypothetical protein